ncbi:MAG: hypothetical protein ABI759_02520 [Candidatus Solibacter sp.]
MNLVDLRKLAIRKRATIRFGLKNGMQCVISETGIARVPELQASPDFNLEAELAGATEFVLEEVPVAGAKGAKTRPTPLSRAELSAMTQMSPTAAAAHDEHDEE